MKSTNFGVFKKECLKWQKKLELNNYDIEIKQGSSNTFMHAWCKTEADYNADVYFDRTWKSPSLPEIKAAAKHEMVHILLGRLSVNAKSRFISPGEIQEAEEEVVRKLTKLI